MGERITPHVSTAVAVSFLPPLCALDTIDRATANDRLVAWGHKMGPIERPTYAVEAHHALIHHRRIVAVVSTMELRREVAGKTGIRRDESVELVRLCAERPGINRAMLRLWREFVLPDILMAHGRRIALSYSDSAHHRGDIYRFDGWKNLGAAGGGGLDKRTGKSGRKLVIWAWPTPTPAEGGA
jgi:hypothetical protein